MMPGKIYPAGAEKIAGGGRVGAAALIQVPDFLAFRLWHGDCDAPLPPARFTVSADEGAHEALAATSLRAISTVEA
jgi:hypothetical protein